MHKMLATGRGVWENVSPKILFEILMLLGYFWGHFWVDTMVSETRRQFHMYEYLAFLPTVSYSTGVSFPIVCLSCKLHPLQIWRVRLIFHLEIVGRKTGESFFTLFEAIVSTCHLCACGPCVSVCQATLIGDTKQGASEGKSGLVETELTGLAATTL